MKSNEFMVQAGAMLNAYPDSIGGSIQDIAEFLSNDDLKEAFQAFYVLPSIFNTDLDRGFSVIDYEINELYATKEELENLKNKGYKYKFDFILNHMSVLSKPFQDILQHGKQSKYKDFFINWNDFWEGHGEMTEDGYIQPQETLIQNMFFRKPGLPILSVRMPDGSEIPYWNTFYQKVSYPTIDAQDVMKSIDVQYSVADELATTSNRMIQSGVKVKDIDYGRFSEHQSAMIELLESRRKYLGQMDLNIQSPLVWDFYEETLQKLSQYGADIVRLDAFAYAPKTVGEKNFLNEPGTWELLARVHALAEKYHLNTPSRNPFDV
jgi:sucrose phosphorylase